MSSILTLLAFLCLVGLIVGLINPALLTSLFKNQLSRWKIAGIFIGAFLVVSILNGFINPQKSTTPANQTAIQEPTSKPTAVPTPEPTKRPVSPTPTPAPIPTDANGFPMDAEAVTVAQIAKVPSAYNQQKVTFTCRVASFAKNDNGDAAAINCVDPNDVSSIIQISGSLFDFTQINQGDTVRIYGMGTGAATGKNAFGGDVTEGLVDGLFINDITSGYKN